MATKSSPKVQEFEFHSVPKLSTWQNFKRALYDPEKKEVFGRTGKSWYQLLIFYTIFYACLAVFCAICTKGLLLSLSDEEPTYQLGSSLIGTNPGLGFRPISNNTEEGSLIWYDLDKSETSQKWINLVDEFLSTYNIQQVGKNYQKCDYNEPVKKGRVCTVELDDFGPCTRDNNYSYNSTSPCVFLKINRIFGWIPEFYTESLPEMPSDLKNVVENQTQVWISCEGENPYDKENIGGFKYFPSQGFPGYYFPYRNTPNYLSPLIAVQIVDVQPNVVVNIECRAWAKNIIYNGSNKNREGSVHFEILVDTRSGNTTASE